MEIDGQPVSPPNQPPSVNGVIISSEYFRVLGMPLLRGRSFTGRDGLPGQAAAIVNQRFANKYWPGADPLGKRLRILWPAEKGEEGWLTVVGVAPDVHYREPSQEIGPLVYLPYRQAPPQRYLVLLARGSQDGHALIAPMRAMVERVNPDVTLTYVLTLPEFFAQMRWGNRLFGSLFVVFAFIGLALASVGIYAVMAYSVSQRTQEIGIRMALGAPQASILKLIVGYGSRLALLGVVAGLAASFAATRVMTSWLVGVTPTDTATFSAVALLLVAVAVLACYVPARRAARLDPLAALRTQ
jgi:putative ABC transport system permease protein